MGWAKYDEDIREAVEDRWRMKNRPKRKKGCSNDYCQTNLNANWYSGSTYPLQVGILNYTYRTVR